MAKTGHPNVVHEITSPWKGNNHVWRLVANHSGTSFSASSDQIAFLQDCWNLVYSHYLIQHSGSGSWLSGVKYYDGVDSVALYENSFASETAAVAAGYNAADAAAFASTNTHAGPLESCVVLAAPVGVGSTGKPVSLKKYIHQAAVNISEGGTDQVPYASGGAAIAAKLGDGSLHGTRVICSKTGRQGTWGGLQYYGNHQMPRRRKKKVVTTGSSILDTAISLAESAAKAAADTAGISVP